MISPIIGNHQYEEIIKSSEAKSKIIKPSVLIPVPEFDNALRILSPNNSVNKFFAGKEEFDMSNENIQVVFPPSTESNSRIVSSQKIEIHTKSPSILEVENFTSTSHPLSALDSLKQKQNLSSGVELYSENTSDVTFIALAHANDNITEMSNVAKTNYPVLSENNDRKKLLTVENNAGVLNLQGTAIFLSPYNRTFYEDKKNYEYSITTNDSIASDIIEISSIEQNKTAKRKKRSFEYFFLPNVQVSRYVFKYKQ